MFLFFLGEIDKACRYPEEQIKKMGELGLMGINVKEKYGGSELDALAYAIAMEEISRGCANAGNIMTAHNSLYIHPISKYGTEAQNFEHVTPFVTGISIKKHLTFKKKRNESQIREQMSGPEIL